MMSRAVSCFICALLFALAFEGGPLGRPAPAWAAPEDAPVFRPQPQAIRFRQPDLYTQGLFLVKDASTPDTYLYESSGRYGRSIFCRWLFPDAAPLGLLNRLELPGEIFAEGAALAEGEIYLLTWKENRGFALNPETLAVKREFGYEGEGWGLAWDGRLLWRSDGGDKLYPHRPGDFAPAGEPLAVRDGDRPVRLLNELEWDPGHQLMLANIFTENRVAAINMAEGPGRGQVAFWLDASELAALAAPAIPPDADRREAVLNGLALSPDGKSLWLTGKLWPRLYQAAWPPMDWRRTAADGSFESGEDRSAEEGE